MAVVAIAPDRRVLYRNAAAAAVLERIGSPEISNGHLRLPSRADAALRAILASDDGRGWFEIDRENSRPILVRIGRASSEHADGCFFLLFEDPERLPERNLIAALRAVYDLTEAESRVACLIGRGYTPFDAALKLGIAEVTARTQLKQVFLKMGVSRQSDLVAAVLHVNRLEPLW
jgi:DNA-binding CsgD family transcriptional regulator